MKAKAILLSSLVGLSLAVAACGGGSGEGASDDVSGPAAGSQLAGGEGSALILPGQFLEFEGRKYELIEAIDATTLDADQFSQKGEATSVAIDSSGTTVFERDGDNANVYTFERVDGDGAERPDNWLKWKAAS